MDVRLPHRVSTNVLTYLFYFGGGVPVEIQIITKEAKSRWVRFDDAVGKWSRMGSWTPEKQRVWIKYACPELKKRELVYKDALYKQEEV